MSEKDTEPARDIGRSLSSHTEAASDWAADVAFGPSRPLAHEGKPEGRYNSPKLPTPSRARPVAVPGSSCEGVRVALGERIEKRAAREPNERRRALRGPSVPPSDSAGSADSSKPRGVIIGGGGFKGSSSGGGASGSAAIAHAAMPSPVACGGGSCIIICCCCTARPSA